MKVVDVRRLTKRYRKAGAPAVEEVDLEAEEGELFCLLGPNGAGKTTIVSILTTTLEPTSGEIRIAGRDLLKDRAGVRRSIGVVFQDAALDRNLTAEENIRLHAVLYGLFPWRPWLRLMPAEYRRSVGELADMLALGRDLSRPVKLLSGGTRRKLEIVRSLLHRPQVLFLDEPTAGLDAQSRRELWAHLNLVRRERRTAVFLTTHYLEEAERADQVVILGAGRAIARGAPGELKQALPDSQLVLDGNDRARLSLELTSLGLRFAGEGPFRVFPEGLSAQEVIGRLRTPLGVIRSGEPSLEETYLELLKRAGL